MLRSLAKFWSHFFNKSRRKLHVGAGSETPQSPIIHQLHWCDWWSGCWLVRYHVYIYIYSICVCIYIWRFPKIEVPPKSSILRGFSIINHPCWDIPHLWKPPYIFTEKQLSGVELRLWLWQLGKSMANYCQRRICLSPWLLQLTEGTTRHPLNYHQCLNLVESLPGLHPPYPRSTMVCRP